MKKLREKISCAKDGLEYVDIESQAAELNGNNDPNESDDNVAYWYEIRFFTFRPRCVFVSKRICLSSEYF